jgi:DNA repair exonuclease SbcCD ATPase subunit
LNEIDNEPISTSPTHEELAEDDTSKEFPTDPTQCDILAAINSLCKKVDIRLADISKSIGTLTETVKATKGRVHEVAQATVEHEARLQDIEKQCATFKNDNKTLKARLEILELHSRRQNIRIFGIQEDTEKGKPTEFVLELIRHCWVVNTSKRP